MLRAHANDQFPLSIAENEAYKAFVAQIPSDLLEIIRRGRFEDVKLTLVGFNPGVFWGRYKTQYNMLKHANRDALVGLDPALLNNIEVLIHACAGYVQLGFFLSIEMQTYHLYYNSIQPELLGLTEEQTKRVMILRKHDGRDRLEACRFIIGDSLLSKPT